MRIPTHLLCILSITPQAVTADINETTSRYLRTEYMCQVGIDDGVKPVPAELDHFRQTNHYGVADLYGDGTIDFFFGFSDDTFSLDRLRLANEGRDTKWPLEMFAGNADRSFSNHQYSFYSPDPAFILPDNSRFLVARTFAVQDYNSDGVDDFAVAHFGRDYEPWDPRSNELFLSGDEGYQFSILPGGRGQNHGAAAGDIDGDGDVDLVVSRINPNLILFLENDGEGQFSLRNANGVSSQSPEFDGMTVGLWDIDDDGHLDFVTSRQTVPFDGGIALVYWGRDGFSFEAKPVVVTVEGLSDSGATIMRNGYQMTTAPGALDFDFADFDNDGSEDIAIVTQSDFYRGWEVSVAQVAGRDISAKVIDQSSDDAFFALFWINACDAQLDGDFDLIYEHFGQNFQNVWQPLSSNNTSRLDRYVWLNDGLGNLTRHMLESPVYFYQRYHAYLASNADWLGVASQGYLPSQSYFPNTLDDQPRFLHPFYRLGRSFERKPYIMVPEVASRFPHLEFGAPDNNASVSQQNSESEVSPRVRAIIDARRQQTELNETPDSGVSTTQPAVASAMKPTSSATTTLSPRAQAALDAIRRGDDPHAAIEETEVLPATTSVGRSVAQENDPEQVSDRVRAILESRRNN